nr:MAG TPA: replication initiator protein [Caudoviricetes sp.]
MIQLKFNTLYQAKEKALTDEVCSLPLSAQALYLHILFNGMFDKDGNITNIKTLAKAIGASTGDVRMLTDEKFNREIKGENR